MNNKLLVQMIDKGYSLRDATVFVRAKGRCEYCDEQLIHDRIKFDSVQFDHIVPKSKGGGEEHENIALSCQICNTAKSTFVPIGENREELISSAVDHVISRRSHANQFWRSISSIFQEHGYT